MQISAKAALIRIERATIARQKYVLQTPAEMGNRTIDHQLCSYILMLEDLAAEAGASAAEIAKAVNDGAAIAQAEHELSL